MVAPPDQTHGRRRAARAGERGPRRPLGRPLGRLVVVLVVLAVLAGGAAVAAPVADGAVRAAAQERVAQVVAAQTGATGGVDVVVEGRWFVPQALAGRYPLVRVVARDVPADGLRLEEVRADLRDVTAPLRDVLGGAPQVRVGSSTAQVLVTYAELNALLAAQDQPLEVSAADGEAQGQLRVTTSAEVLGREVALSGFVDLQVQAPGGGAGGGGGGGGELQAVPTSLDTGAGFLDRLSRRVLAGLRDRLAFTVPLDGLPLGQELTGAAARSDGVVVTTAGGPTDLG